MPQTPRPRPRILRAVSRMALGGVQRGILATLKRADHQRFEYAVLCTKKEGTWAGQVRDLGVPLYFQKTLPPWDPYQLWRLSRLIRRINPDLIHIHMASMVLPVMTAGRLAGVRRFLIQHHNFYDRHWDALNPFLRRWEMALTRRAGVVVAVSESVGQCTRRCVGLPEDKVVTVYNGIELERFMNVPPHDPRPEWGLAPATPLVVHVARYLNTKRIEDFIEAGALVAGRWTGPEPRPVFVVIGGGAKEYEDLYKRRIKELGAERSVLLAGSRDDVASILPTAQVGALASENEGFGQVILEYLAAGLPVAATSLPPIKELVSDGEQALLSPPRRPDLLADNIERLLRQRDLAARLVESGQGRLERFSWQSAVRDYEALYERLLQHP